MYLLNLIKVLVVLAIIYYVIKILLMVKPLIHKKKKFIPVPNLDIDQDD